MTEEKKISDEYPRYCMKNYCDKVATVEVQLKSGLWVPFCMEHLPKRAVYIRKIKVKEDV